MYLISYASHPVVNKSNVGQRSKIFASNHYFNVLEFELNHELNYKELHADFLNVPAEEGQSSHFCNS